MISILFDASLPAFIEYPDYSRGKTLTLIHAALLIEIFIQFIHIIITRIFLPHKVSLSKTDDPVRNPSEEKKTLEKLCIQRLRNCFVFCFGA